MCVDRDYKETERALIVSHQKVASIIINRHKASIPDACSTGYCKEEKSVNSVKNLKYKFKNPVEV